MVIAEVPLWVVHDSTSGATTTTTTTTTTAAISHNDAGTNASSTSSTTPNSSSSTLYYQLAASSLDLLLPSSSGNSNNKKKKKKCAIYSLDIHPDGTKFATAGGDGTVRIWNTTALFHHQHHGAKFLESTTKTATATSISPTDHTASAFATSYVSTDYSSSSSTDGKKNGTTTNHRSHHQDDDDDGDDDDDDDNNNKNIDGTKKKKRKDDNNNNNNNNEDCMSVSSSSSSYNHMNLQQQQQQQQQPAVHDLNDVVRKKGTPTTTTSAAATAATLRTTSSDDHAILANNNTSSSSDNQINSNNAEPAITTPPPTTTTTTTGSSSTINNNGNAHHHPTHSDHHHHHRLLCTLSAHTGNSVLIVRFSNNGKYLASGSDDSCVCIYTPAAAAAAGTGGGGGGNLTSSSNNVEHWTRIRLCRGHALDVVDLAWSPDDTYLVSCSLDSETPIAVWNMRDLRSNCKKGTNTTTSSSMIMKPYKVLGVNIHTSTVKGVAFDPAGTYFASSGDDPAVCIWRAYDDWGLEQRIDGNAGIFRTWANTELSNQSLFRRISWSTDGAFIGSTNSVVKNKNVLSTITRGDGWKTGPGAANLVGHKQPVVCCRHSSKLLSNTNNSKKQTSTSSDDEDNNNGEPDYSTLLAMGDRRGFVTVWSTKKSRPIFKLQCSESRSTVTDLAWGEIPGGLFLLVSLLDGQVVALKFAVPDELGDVLTDQEKARVFQLRYGIDIMDSGVDGGEGWSQKHRFGGRNNKLIENALQMTLEDRVQNNASDDHQDHTDPQQQQQQQLLTIKSRQEESRSKDGKKRVRPVLLTQMNDSSEKRSKNDSAEDKKQQEQRTDPLQHALDVADRAEAAASAVPDSSGRKAVAIGDEEDHVGPSIIPPPRTPHSRHVSLIFPSATVIPHSTDRIHTADLPVLDSCPSEAMVPVVGGDVDKLFEKPCMVVECKNIVKVPLGSRGSAIPCIDISIVTSGRISWKDQIVGASCSAISTSKHLLAIGMVDGAIQLYSTAHGMGWASGNAFRSHPPFIVLHGNPIVSLQLRDKPGTDKNNQSRLELMVVTADGSFGIYAVLPKFILLYKGSILPAMTHMAASISPSTTEQRLPKLSRIYVTETDRLVLLLALQPNIGRNMSLPSNVASASPSRQPSGSGSVDVAGVGGSLQAFVYEKPSAMWIRISDSRFILSDFYNILPQLSAKTKNGSSNNILEQMDDSARIGSMQSTLKKASYRGQQQDRRGSLIYSNEVDGEDSGNYIATRSHCEDRMSCAIALGSADEFKYWLTMYVQTLSRAGHGSQLRMLTDMLLGSTNNGVLSDTENDTAKADGNWFGWWWWLGTAAGILNLEPKSIIKSIVIPEMSKNRALQRITNEIALEIDSMQ